MTYVQARAAMQLIAEEEIGRRERAAQRRKDQRFAASIAALKAEEGR
jgi:hypothetical protein